MEILNNGTSCIYDFNLSFSSNVFFHARLAETIQTGIAQIAGWMPSSGLRPTTSVDL